MKTITWLAVVALLAVALAVIRALLGESPGGIVVFFVLAISVVHFLLGNRNWFRAGLAGIVAATVYAMYAGLLLPADTAGKQVGLVLFLLALATPFVVHFISDRRRRQSQS
jgi:hypothetical protein